MFGRICECRWPDPHQGGRKQKFKLKKGKRLERVSCEKTMLNNLTSMEENERPYTGVAIAEHAHAIATIYGLMA